MNNLQQKINQLPAKVKEYVASVVSTDVNMEITGQFDVPAGKLADLTNLQTRVFVKEAPLADFVKLLQSEIGLAPETAKSLALQIVGRKFLMVDEYFQDLASKLIKDLGGNPVDFQADLAKQKEALKKELVEEATALEAEKAEAVAGPVVAPLPEEEPVVPVTPAEEKANLENLFKNNLSMILSADAKENEFVEDLDLEIIGFLIDDDKFKNYLEAALVNSEELLTSQPLIIDGKNVQPTTANWLKDFLKNSVGDDFNLNLTEYWTKSGNIKVLAEEEKKKLNNLFRLYYNLHYWPDSVVSLPVEQWQIIPYEREAELAKTISRPMVEEPVVVPAPAPTFQAGAAPGFHFHPEDEAEAGKFKPSPAVIAHQMNWPELAEEVVKQANLGLTDEVLIKRLKNIILLNLRDIRDVLETKDVLMRPVKVGGLGLDENKAEEVLALIKNKGQALPEKFKELANKRAQTEAELIESAEKKKMEEFQRRQSELAEHIRVNAEITKQKLATRLAEPQARQAKLDVSHELAPPAPALFKQPTARPFVRPVSQPIAPPARKEMPVRPPQPIPPIGGFSPKPRLQDVRTAPKLVGPLEELKNLNLVDFRRLSNNPMAAADKIKEQIDLLERDSFAKRLAGIKAWRNSGLYRLYLDIGRQGIITGRLVKDIIAERQTASQPTLTEAEFEAIMDLNKSLRF
ncbi:MAG: hypothetical protein V1684_00365 [bacterium]